MKFCDLWKVCEGCIAAYDKAPPSLCLTEDQHIQNTIAPHLKAQRISGEEAVFIEEACKGVFRYRGILLATMQGYCQAKKRNKQDTLAVQLMTYLILYRFEELGGAQMFQALVNKSTSNVHIAEVLECLLDPHVRTQHFVPCWRTAFDDAYVENVIVNGTIERLRPQLEVVARHFRQKASGTGAVGGATTSAGSEKAGGATNLARGSTANSARSGGTQSNANNNKQQQLHRSNTAEKRRQQKSLGYSSSSSDEDTDAEYISSPSKAPHPPPPLDASQQLPTQVAYNDDDDDDDDDESPARDRDPAAAEAARAAAAQRRQFRLFAFQKEEEIAKRERRQKPTLPPHEVRELEHVRPPQKFPKVLDTCTEAEKNCIKAVASGAARGKSGALSTLDPQVKQRNREREKEIKFAAFSATERPTQLPKLLEEQRQREEDAVRPLFPNRPSKEEVRQQLQRIKAGTDVKMTAAAIRREDMLYRKRQEDAERAELRRMQEMRDDAEFLAWKAREEAKEQADRDARVLQRKLEMVEADEHAKAVTRKQQQRNLAISRQFRKAMGKWRAGAKAEADAKAEANRRQADEIRRELAEKTQAAVQSVQKQKTTLAADVREASHRNEQAVAMQLELERQRKQALIDDIKSVHRAFVERQRQQHSRMHEQAERHVELGQLVTMTVEQLREKLKDVKAEQSAWTQQQHEAICEAKHRRKATEAEMMANIEANRQKFRQTKDRQRLEREKKEADAKAAASLAEEKRLIALQAQLEEKREARKAEAQKRAEAERQRRLAAQLLSADAGAMQRHQWEEMERGQENRIVGSQNKRLAAAAKEKRKQSGIASQREENIEKKEAVRAQYLRDCEDLFIEKRTQFEEDKKTAETFLATATKAMKEEAKQLKMLATLR